MEKFKKGDKVKLSKFYGKGDDYSIGDCFYNNVKKCKFLTVIRYEENVMGYGFVWFKEVDCYWPPNWFEKLNSQLELDFNEK